MFVVFEGIDGSGKTTLSSRVAKRLREAGLSVEHLREGGKFTSYVTQAIREFGRDARNLELTPHAELMLYVARDVQLLEEQTRPALERCEIVIADRFLYSAENLSRFGRGLPEADVRPILAAAARGLQPDLVILVDVDPHLARARRQAEKRINPVQRPPSRKGLGGVGLQHRMSAGYATMAAREPERWQVIDNDGDLETTVERVVALLQDAARSGARAALERFRASANAINRRARAEHNALGSPADALETFIAWLTQRMQREPEVAGYMMAGLHGAAIDDCRRALAARSALAALRASSGLDDALSWELREQLAASEPSAVARSLSGLPTTHPRAARWRKTLRAHAPLELLGSYDGSDDDEAFALREALYREHPVRVVGSLNRLASARAWALRDRFIADQGPEPFTHYEPAFALCRSIAWLDDDRAWALRKAAREVAPVAAIASIAGVMNSDRAWKWRARWVERAPKTVFGTLRHNDDARGWPLREKLAASCKEVIDSIQDLDHPTAWALREQCLDIWPSTVVKSLGPLCARPEGERITARQLQRYPGNLSLLKHASAIALGLHSAAGGSD